jgi:hypothetical protein
VRSQPQRFWVLNPNARGPVPVGVVGLAALTLNSVQGALEDHASLWGKVFYYSDSGSDICYRTKTNLDTLFDVPSIVRSFPRILPGLEGREEATA